MPTNKASEADLDFCTLLSQRGVTARGKAIRPRQLQEWRRLGVIPSPIVERLGRSGTRSVYPPDAAEQVAEVAALLDRSRNMKIVILALFAAGRTPTEPAVMDAYAWVIDRWEEQGRRIEAKRNEPSDAYGTHTRRFAASIGRDDPETLHRWNRSARQRASETRAEEKEWRGISETTSKHIREQDASGFAEALLDEEGDPEPMFRALGFSDATLEEIKEIGGPPSFADFRTALKLTTFSELVVVRDMVLKEYYDMITPLIPKVMLPDLDDPLYGGLYRAFGVLSAVVVGHRMRSHSDQATDWTALG